MKNNWHFIDLSGLTLPERTMILQLISMAFTTGWRWHNEGIAVYGITDNDEALLNTLCMKMLAKHEAG